MRFKFGPPRIWITFSTCCFFIILINSQHRYFLTTEEEFLPLAERLPYTVFNKECKMFRGNVNSPFYLNYTTNYLQFPIFPSSNKTFQVAKYHFAVNTSPKGFLSRRAIRETWKRLVEDNMAHGKMDCGATVRFYVGQTSDPLIARKLVQEMKLYDDMVFIEFCDSYETLPLKTFNLMKHAREHVTGSAKFVIKIDDDVMPNLSAFFDCFPTIEKEQFGIYGWVTVDKVSKEKWDKYGIPVQRFNHTKTPAFSHGPAYAVRITELPKMLEAAKETQIVNLEDVWFGGMVAERAKVLRYHQNRFILSRKHADLDHHEHNTPKAAFFYHNVGPRMLKKYWSKMLKCCGCFQHCGAFQHSPTTTESQSSDLILNEEF